MRNAVALAALAVLTAPLLARGAPKPPGRAAPEFPRPDALTALAHLLATLHDKKGEVAIEGIARGVDLLVSDLRMPRRFLRALAQDLGLPELSMGMSNDFEVAIEEGATQVRIGTALFV